MEAYDLSNAVRDYAIDLGWIDYDPFSVVAPAVTITDEDESETIEQDPSDAADAESVDAE